MTILYNLSYNVTNNLYEGYYMQRGTRHSAEAIEKIKSSWAKYKGKPISEATKKKISNACKGRVFSEQHKLNLAKARKGKKLPQSVKDAISRTKLGIKYKVKNNT